MKREGKAERDAKRAEIRQRQIEEKQKRMENLRNPLNQGRLPLETGLPEHRNLVRPKPYKAPEPKTDKDGQMLLDLDTSKEAKERRAAENQKAKEVKKRDLQYGVALSKRVKENAREGNVTLLDDNDADRLERKENENSRRRANPAPKGAEALKAKVEENKAALQEKKTNGNGSKKIQVKP